MNPEQYKTGAIAIHKPTHTIGFLAKRYFDSVEIQCGTIVYTYSWDDVVLLDDCNVSSDGETFVLIKYFYESDKENVYNFKKNDASVKMKMDGKLLKEYLQGHPGEYSTGDLVELSNMTKHAVYVNIKNMQREGLIEKSGYKKGAKWIVKKKDNT